MPSHSHSTATAGPATSRLEWVDWLRGLAILFVVFYHAVIALNVGDMELPHWAVVVNEIVSPYRMPLLMFLSGMLLTRSLGRRRSVYVAGKLRRIGWPYLVWTTVIVVFMVGASQLFGDGTYALADVPALLLDPRTYTWYLGYLLVYYLIALVTTPLLRAIAVPGLFVVSIMVADGDGWSRLTFLLACFFLGDLAARFPAVWEWMSGRILAVVVAGAVVGVTVSLTLDGVAVRYGAVTLVAVLALLVTTHFVAERVARHSLFAPLARIGRESIVFYTVHWIVIAAGVHLLVRAGVTSGGLALFILFGGSLLVCWAAAVGRRRSAAVRLLFEFPTVKKPSRRRAAHFPAARS